MRGQAVSGSGIRRARQCHGARAAPLRPGGAAPASADEAPDTGCIEKKRTFSASISAIQDAERRELQVEATRAWNELFREVEAALGEDPTSPKAEALSPTLA